MQQASEQPAALEREKERGRLSTTTFTTISAQPQEDPNTKLKTSQVQEKTFKSTRVSSDTKEEETVVTQELKRHTRHQPPQPQPPSPPQPQPQPQLPHPKVGDVIVATEAQVFDSETGFSNRRVADRLLSSPWCPQSWDEDGAVMVSSGGFPFFRTPTVETTTVV
ncbi:hypothetical protein GWK47_007492 [Chionoecetes opilio]|uniref:Uncharacterized protein n=1 Tax=Chionoecetes opilio TaxID=41210 RepID=A0A8J5CT20_CHIOP|nr:hypothetical protein GWK47_007492 [Chionoecetes opilio]